jgi:membrane protein implicated in regulation of membrane protease activity
MPKKSFTIILAACVALMPFLGFPSSWEDGFYVVAGILILLLSIDWNFLKRKKARPVRARKGKQVSGSETYVESAPKVSSEERGEL